MKRTFVLLAGVLLLALVASPIMAQEEEWDVGLSFTPQSEDTFGDAGLLGLHLGYRFSHVLYGTWDALIVPPHLVEQWTGYEYTDTETNSTFYVQGIYRPGFMNLFDFGLGIPIGPFFASAQAGLNYLYILQQSELEGYSGRFGANIRLGGGMRFDYWAVVLNGTVAFPDLATAFQTVADLGSDVEAVRARAADIFTDYMLFSLGFVLYL